jgi:PHD/YefM family antitoxin component YafN of YafNO toxin-antitoxin module
MEIRVAPVPLVFAAARSYIGFAMSSVLPLPLPTEGAADRLTEAAARAERDKERVVLIRDGKPVAAVVPIEDLEALEAEDEYWSRAADEAIGEWETAGRPAGIPIEDIARGLGIDLTADPDAAP